MIEVVKSVNMSLHWLLLLFYFFLKPTVVWRIRKVKSITNCHIHHCPCYISSNLAVKTIADKEIMVYKKRQFK